MGDITVSTSQVGVVYPALAEIYNVKVAVDVTAGQALYQRTDGAYGLADANAAGAQQFRGVALETAKAGGTVSMLKRGILAGYTLGTYDDVVYLSDTAGAFSDTVGTLEVLCGRVTSINDPAKTEVLYVEADWLRQWEA